MSKFLTPPVWYDENGNLVEILTGNISSESGTALGKGSFVTGHCSVAIGRLAQSSGDDTIIIGYNSNCPSGQGNIVIGTGSKASHLDSDTDASTVIGNYSEVIGPGNIAIGESITMGNDNFDSIENIAIGGNSVIQGGNCIAIGSNSTVYGSDCIAIGGQIQLGTSESYASNTIQIGATDKPYTFKVGNKDVFGTINAAANTFAIGTTKYKATYDSSSATLNFVTA